MATTQDKQYFNLHTSGIGYLGRVRWVHPGKKSSGRRSEPFLGCSISALRGDSDDVCYTYFDLRVNGQEAIEIVEGLQEAVAQGRKVIVAFRIGDIYPHMYERDVRDANRQPTGQKEWAVLTKGRLLLIYSVSVDGENVYTREKAPAETSGRVDESGEFSDKACPGEEAPVREEIGDMQRGNGQGAAPAEPQPQKPVAPPPAPTPVTSGFRKPFVAPTRAPSVSRNQPVAQPAGFDEYDDDIPF